MDELAAEVVGEVAPVRGVEQDDVGAVARRDPADRVRLAEDVGRVDRHRREYLRRRELELGRRECADERQALAERAPRIEVRRQGDGRTGVDELARGRHRPPEHEGASREADADDAASRERGDPVHPRRFEVVDGARAELDRQRDRAGLRELVAVEAQRESRPRAGLEVPARLCASNAPRSRKTSAASASSAASGSTSVSANSRYASASSNSGGTAWAPSQVGTPPAAATARSEASSVSRSSP